MAPTPYFLNSDQTPNIFKYYYLFFICFLLEVLLILNTYLFTGDISVSFIDKVSHPYCVPGLHVSLPVIIVSREY